MTNYAQLSLIKDNDEKTRDVLKEHVNTLRETVIRDRGFFNMEDADSVAAILSLCKTPCAIDTLTAVENLLEAFGSIKGVLEARREQLIRVIGMTAGRVDVLQMVLPIVRLWERETMKELNKIGNSREAENYCLSLLAGNRNEQFYVIALNAQCKVLGQRKVSEGSLSEVSAYPRIVMETALNYNAHSVLLCHNHPGGTCAPSQEDIRSTQQLQKLLNGVGILVLDHIIVAGDRTYSMIQHGDIDYRTR